MQDYQILFLIEIYTKSYAIYWQSLLPVSYGLYFCEASFLVYVSNFHFGLEKKKAKEISILAFRVRLKNTASVCYLNTNI